MAQDTQQSKDAKAVAKTASKVASKLGQKAAKKAAAKAVTGAATGKIKLAIAAGLLNFLQIVITIAFLILFPASIISSATDLVTGAAEDFGGWLDEVQTSFSATAIQAFESIDDFFTDIYEFFTGDTTESDLEEQINEVIKTGGLNMAGEETDYGNTTNGETSIVYKYFLDEFVDIKKTAQSGTTPEIEEAGQEYIDAHRGELTATDTTSDPIDNGDGTTTVVSHVYDTTNIEIVGVYEGDDMGDFFKPVFYLLAADSLTQYDNEEGDFAMNSLVILANEVSKNCYSIIPDEPTKFIEKISKNEQTKPFSNTTQVTYTHTYQVNVPYRISPEPGTIAYIVTTAGKDPEDDKGTIKATVQQLCNYYGAEMFEDEEDDWSIISFTGKPHSNAAGPLTSPLGEEEAAEALANISLEGCPDGAQRIVDIIRNIDAYAVTGGNTAIMGQVRFQNSGCQRTVADIYMCAGFPRPGLSSGLANKDDPNAHLTSEPPPFSGFVVFASSPYLVNGVDYGHSGIYFVGEDGVGYVLDNIFGQPHVDTFAHWSSEYRYLGYTSYGYF